MKAQTKLTLGVDCASDQEVADLIDAVATLDIFFEKVEEKSQYIPAWMLGVRELSDLLCEEANARGIWELVEETMEGIENKEANA